MADVAASVLARLKNKAKDSGISYLTNFESRATIDVDFLLRDYPNSVGHFLRTVHTCYPFLFSAPAFALV